MGLLYPPQNINGGSKNSDHNPTMAACRSPSSFTQTIADSSDLEKANAHPWNAPKYLKTKKENQNFEVYQQAMLIALINSQASVVLERPMKYSKINITSPRISKIIFSPTDEINVSQLVDKHCKSVFAKEISEGIPESTALRRLEKNRKVFVQNLLIDITRELDFEISSVMARKSGKAMQVERISMIYFSGNCLYNKNEIVKMGNLLNQSFIERTKCEKPIELQPNDQLIAQVLLNATETA
ncbi:hypothetical protein EIN_055510 [Entamoeba invadens IP1]|uniref:hypothetical protein n=1 Tax=Entamoeba invadens IP1 TaxID=370355 RepID=UPI0002C3F04B|nr:hypothetical protein EIN_055510 [Entamoeba invadens IP1]ELP93226.1 hypothetical protein EIN_055510 [Entamoeba invadens IP1]|eukprot:XP_004259997.1 hypothetical protein EIN_055510 [Entamoeba invadens IP1]